MIGVRLMGGLGNQIFQWAYGKSLSVRLGMDLYLDISFLQARYENITKREYSLWKFDSILDPLCVLGSDFENFHRISDGSAFPPPIASKYLLDGFFQSEIYFSEIAGLVKKAISPPLGFSTTVREGSVSMHVRRTDYLKSNGFHPVQDVSYYEKAISSIGEYSDLYVFSDDPEWCEKTLRFDRMTVVDGNDEVEDLWTMSSCRDNIIANSSFSWWGAWINPNPNKKVVYPKKWFGFSDSEIAPIDWIGI